MKITFLPVLLLIFFSQSLIGQQTAYAPNHHSPQVQVHNRILCNINGKAITVLDIKKKLDLVFHQQFPQYANSVQALYQFYSTNWYPVLNDVINRELVISDAQDRKLPVSDGEVREEMQNMFGPDIIKTLNQLGLTYEEACKIVLNDIKVQRMMILRVNLKAKESVTPQAIKAAYKDMIAKEAPADQWHYVVISVRDANKNKAQRAADVIFNLLTKQNVATDAVQHAFYNLPEHSGSQTKVTVSEEYSHTAKELSPAYKTVLESIKPGYYSLPVVQHSRSSGEELYRIFNLTQHYQGTHPPLEEVEEKIKDELMDMAIEREANKYIDHLRKYYGITEDALPSKDIQPFSLH